MIELDGFGKPCPMPLVMTKQALDEGAEKVAIRVDNETAVKNISRLAEKSGLSIAVESIEGGFLLALEKGGATERSAALIEERIAPSAEGGFAVFIGKDHVGEGDLQLGYNLMKMALYALSCADEAPASLLFMNSGVKLLAGEEEQVIESVKKMQERGAEVLVCGTCLDFYGLKEQLKVGDISNMYDILGQMQKTAKVITL